MTYGMGLETDRTWGVPVVHHGGSMAGYKTDLIVLPDADIGAVLLTNSDGDGTTSFISTAYGLTGSEFVVGDRAGKRVLLMRDGQHEYVFAEV